MVKLDPSMILKVKRDTFYLAEPNRGVYLRNNSCSFRLEGNGIDQWVEKLLPMFNGEYSLGTLTDGLPEPYRKQVCQIAEVLLENGFVRDVSQDEQHHLSEQVLKKFASQIEFVDNLAGSGASRFQSFRYANVLAVGSGPMLNSVVSTLLESGLQKVNVAITDEIRTNRNRMAELVNQARKTDLEVEYEEFNCKDGDWNELLMSFDSVLYVSQNGNVEELRLLQSICKEERKTFIPAIQFKQTGVAGPLFAPDSELCWESAWRRLHFTVLEKEPIDSAVSLTTGALLANVMTFELYKELTGVTKTEQRNRIYLLDLETFEGRWHPVSPHPLVTGAFSSIKVGDLEDRLDKDFRKAEPEKLLQYFSLLTSKETGILHEWEEGDLKQLPLAQCRVQAADLLSDGPSELLAARICSGVTHEEARTEAALTGIESYAARLAEMIENGGILGVGAGETFAEAVGRGLQKCLTKELDNRMLIEKESISLVDLEPIEDQRCAFYIKALTTIQGAPLAGIGKEVRGFPVIWIGTKRGWYGSAGLNTTLALRNALQNALFDYQNEPAGDGAQALQEPEVHFSERGMQSLKIPEDTGRIQREILQAAIEVLKQNKTQMSVYELSIEPIFNKQLEGVYGVSLRGEGSS
ncbi:putative thiazole-containing bacteriocin maturation protein [Bacillus sp. ISL-45]|uniref:putative thiazole-containing bacteriocin maturation protein n=1 Tax=Bacillus sp. ISL-45 TaxID=2819128 RepID=UPI001BE72B56|nr:putative thiazole-containing bacteriocin maturation protein [Bacillus sp. ISL-45]MBT2663169.1 putative thiazole-containing bacteriocin maturation protein [Bacillus sp. ISL-45]